MTKRIILILSIVIFPLATFAEISKDDEDRLTNCTGIYYAYSMIPQGQLELEKIVHSVAAKKTSLIANACVDTLGDENNPSKVIYGNELSKNYVDFEYLTNIIN